MSSDQILEVTSHDFKDNISKYLNMLRRGAVTAIVIKRYRKRIAVVRDFNPSKQSYPRPTW
jgi:hypothetical protein